MSTSNWVNGSPTALGTFIYMPCEGPFNYHPFPVSGDETRKSLWCHLTGACLPAGFTGDFSPRDAIERCGLEAKKCCGGVGVTCPTLSPREATGCSREQVCDRMTKIDTIDRTMLYTSGRL